jgi:hypothetical protein
LTTISLCLLLLGGIFASRIPFDVFVTIVFQRSVLPPRTVAVVRSSQSRGKPSSRNHGEDICHDPCHAKFVAITAGHQLPLTHRALTVPRYQILRVLNRLFLYSCSKPEHPPVGDHSCTTGNRSRNLCYDSWSLSHLGYLYPRTTPVMIKLDHDRSCPWV